METKEDEIVDKVDTKRLKSKMWIMNNNDKYNKYQKTYQDEYQKEYQKKKVQKKKEDELLEKLIEKLSSDVSLNKIDGIIQNGKINTGEE